MRELHAAHHVHGDSERTRRGFDGAPGNDDSIEGSRYGKAVKTQLTAPLEKALNLLKDGNPGNDASACGQLDAFKDRLEKMLKSRRIGTQDADAWRSASDAIGRALGCLDSEADELSE